MTIDQLKVGDKVLVSSNFGSGPVIEGTVDLIEQDIKNGFPGIDYVTKDGNLKWAYIDQIVKKIS